MRSKKFFTLSWHSKDKAWDFGFKPVANPAAAWRA
jgi:hypothetical protein